MILGPTSYQTVETDISWDRGLTGYSSYAIYLCETCGGFLSYIFRHRRKSIKCSSFGGQQKIQYKVLIER